MNGHIGDMVFFIIHDVLIGCQMVPPQKSFRQKLRDLLAVPEKDRPTYDGLCQVSSASRASICVPSTRRGFISNDSRPVPSDCESWLIAKITSPRASMPAGFVPPAPC